MQLALAFCSTVPTSYFLGGILISFAIQEFFLNTRTAKAENNGCWYAGMIRQFTCLLFTTR